MDTEKINTVSVIVSIGIIMAVEIGVQRLTLNPLIKTGLARCIETSLILTVLWRLNNGWACIGLSRDRWMGGFKKGLIWSAGFGVLAAISGALLYFLGINPFRMFHASLPGRASDIAVFYVVGGLIAPVAEEIFFRGIIYGYLKELLKRKAGFRAIPLAVILSTYLFVAAHGMGAGIPWPQLVGGVVFCIAFEKEKSLLTPIVIHSLGNLALFTLSLL